jgi:hypothetical protein
VHEYLRRLLLAVDQGLIEGARLSDASIGHDEDCPYLVWAGECCCDPTIEVVTDSGRLVTVDSEGRLHDIARH